MADSPRPKRSGTIFKYLPAKPGEELGHYVVRCSAPDGTRPLFHLDPSPESPKARASALRSAEAITERLFETGEGGAPRRARTTRKAEDNEDGSTWVDAWLAERKRRGLVGHVESDVRTYVMPTLGKHPRAWTRDDFRRLSRALDSKVQAKAISWKTAANIWGTATKMADDAAESKDDAIRCRTDNPSEGVRGPDRGAKKSKQFLYPSEFLKFATCDEVPLAWRRCVALAIYLYPRAAELRALTPDDLDLEHGTIHIHQSLDGSGNEKPTKTKMPRRFAIELNVLPLLKVIGAIELPAHEKNLSSIFRKMLKRAGIDRAELHKTTATRKAMTFHDLRATGLTWLAVRGDDPLKIMQRAGHTDFKTTQGYVRLAESLGEGFGSVFPALPAELIGGRGRGSQGGPSKPGRPARKRRLLSQNLSQAAQVSETIVRRRGLEPGKETPIQHDLGSIRDRADEPIATQSDAKCAIARDPVTGCDSKTRAPDPVELALARAVELAAAAGQWDVVATLGRELGERRRAREAPAVASLDVERERRRR
jgi:integrase